MILGEVGHQLRGQGYAKALFIHPALSPLTFVIIIVLPPSVYESSF